MRQIRPALSAIMINDDKLMCCGGYMYGTNCDLYDFKSKKWMELTNAIESMHNSGICADELVNVNQRQKIYTGCGTDATKKTQFYDVTKNEWYPLPDTNEKHKYHPILWFEDFNILNIASAWTNTFEKLDLRQKKWNVFVGNDKYDTFDNIFGISVPMASNNVRMCV